MSLHRAEIEAIDAYKSYARKYLPNTETISGLWAPDFDFSFYRCNSSLDALSRYLDDLCPYMHVLRKAAKLRQQHYERFIKNDPDRTEDSGHKHWREALNAVALDAWQKHEFWRVKWSEKFDELIRNHRPRISDICKVAAVRNVDFSENAKAKPSTKIVRPPSLSKKERKRRRRENEKLLKKAVKEAKAEDGQAFSDLGYGNGRHKKYSAPYEFRYVAGVITYAEDSFTDADTYKFDHVSHILVIKPDQFRDPANQLFLLSRLLSPLAGLTDFKDLEDMGGAIVDSLRGFYFANMLAFSKTKHVFLQAIFNFVKENPIFEEFRFLMALVIAVGGIFETVKELTECFKRLRFRVSQDLYENSLALAQQNWLVLRLGFLNTTLRMFCDMFLNLEPAQCDRIFSLYPQVDNLMQEDPCLVKMARTKYKVQENGKSVIRIKGELEAIRGEVRLLYRKYEK